MQQIRKYNIYDKNNVPVAVQIPIDDFNRLTEIIENSGKFKLVEEVKSEKITNFIELKNNNNIIENSNNQQLIKSKKLNKKKFLELLLQRPSTLSKKELKNIEESKNWLNKCEINASYLYSLSDSFIKL